jgi:hypothetical protein
MAPRFTNAAVIRLCLPAGAIDIRGQKGQPGTIEVVGVGFR